MKIEFIIMYKRGTSVITPPSPRSILNMAFTNAGPAISDSAFEQTFRRLLSPDAPRKNPLPCSECKQFIVKIDTYVKAIDTANERIKDAKQRIATGKKATNAIEEELNWSKSEILRLKLEVTQYKNERDAALEKINNMTRNLKLIETEIHHFLEVANPDVTVEPIVTVENSVTVEDLSE